MGQACLSTSGLGRRFGRCWAARDIDIEARAGEIYGFVGKNGAGKTTVLRMVAGLLRPSAGRVALGGGPADARPVLGFLPQSARLVERARGTEVLAFFARLRGVDGARAVDRARRFEVDLRRPVRLLSPGQQRKLQIVIATIGEPRLLLLDEPTAGLDPTGIAQFRSIALDCANEGSAVVVSSHVLPELDRLCRRVGIIDAGRLVFQGLIPSRVRIETSALDEATLAALRQQVGRVVRVDEGGLLLEIERERVPGAVRLLTQRAVDVFGVREEGLESFFHDTLDARPAVEDHQ
jgi:ABC-type multidrug transport system ATPase subunit